MCVDRSIVKTVTVMVTNNVCVQTVAIVCFLVVMMADRSSGGGINAAGITEEVKKKSKCSGGSGEEQEALGLVAPCVDNGSMVADPSAPCCEGVRQLVGATELGCLCEILISAGGGGGGGEGEGEGSESLLHTYVAQCSIPHVPLHFQCTL